MVHEVTLTISNCLFSHGHSVGMYFDVHNGQSSITMKNTDLVENVNDHDRGTSELYYKSSSSAQGSLSLINSTIVHTETHSDYGVQIAGCCHKVTLTNTKIRLTKQKYFGLHIASDQSSRNSFPVHIKDCQFEKSQSVGAIFYLSVLIAYIANCTFSNNTGNHSVIAIDIKIDLPTLFVIRSSSISDNNMTGITIVGSGEVYFVRRNVIQNNRNTEGAGITFQNTVQIMVDGELLLYNNTADKHW